MNTTDLDKFIDLIFSEPTAHAFLSNPPCTEPELVERILTLAQQHGFHFSEDDATVCAKELIAVNEDGELAEQELELIAGGAGEGQIVRLEPVIITAKRPVRAQQIVKLDAVIITGKRHQPEAENVAMASTGTQTHKN